MLTSEMPPRRLSPISIHLIKAQLGHSSLATTARYVDHLNPRQVVDAVASAFADVPVV